MFWKSQLISVIQIVVLNQKMLVTDIQECNTWDQLAIKCYKV